MDRRDIILEFASKTQRGIEIGPYFNPLAPKADGWNVLSLDVFDAPMLRERAARDPSIPDSMVPNIEEVDLLGPAHQVAELVSARGDLGRFDFIVSSHNFEHLPNPIGFLRACSETLRPGGILSMAIPDKRACFDYFRPVSTLGSLLEAYAEERQRPSITQHFDQNSLHCRYRADEGELIGFPLVNDPNRLTALETVEEAYQAWQDRLAAASPDDRPYEDCHCWTFTPNSFRLLLWDLSFLRAVDFVPLRISDTNGIEFYTHLKNTRGTSGHYIDRSEYYRQRQRLLHAVVADAAVNAVSAAHEDLPAAPNRSDDAPADRTAGFTTEVATLQHELSAMRTSTCWRITAPIRLFVNFFRGGHGLHFRQKEFSGLNRVTSTDSIDDSP
jgi:SAM-dependent methyltransferase